MIALDANFTLCPYPSAHSKIITRILAIRPFIGNSGPKPDNQLFRSRLPPAHGSWNYQRWLVMWEDQNLTQTTKTKIKWKGNNWISFGILSENQPRVTLKKEKVELLKPYVLIYDELGNKNVLISREIMLLPFHIDFAGCHSLKATCNLGTQLADWTTKLHHSCKD